MKLNEVTSYAWGNSIELRFGGENNWDEKTFTHKWFDENYPNLWQKGGASGLYWFMIKDKTVQNLIKVKTPVELPKKGTNIVETSKDNLKIFRENLCNSDENGLLVIYNGHEKNVFTRIRSHFALNNDLTTAIGFRTYNLSQYDLRVRIFHHKFEMDDLKETDKEVVRRLLETKRGRVAIEQYWRTIYGWPILCKE
ncbi:hypothetical protein M3661_17250 [Paenibacillus sp. MER 180]|uniref:hypothetical protein n=1 Tax=unclassified Paenibacillus TaxID=185978 RepID=UPI0008064F27|nr:MULTISPECIES: hypothetical protein [unclassified Paenibacillus]MCM3291869.1 hypothetical protein [Paenibacillus sp. MER 180]OBY76485.1 hypothetical protein BBG47_26845 [Paenibacillus sp. KS1]